MTPAQQPLRHSPGLGRSDCVDHAAASGAAGQQVVAGEGDSSGQRRMGRLVAGLCLTVCALAACVAPPREPGSGHLRPDAQPQGKPPALVDAPLLPPQPRPGRKQAEVYSVSVHNVAIRDLLFALARDARLNLDVHPDLAGTVSINAIDQTINEILDRAAMQVDMRYEMEGRNLFVMPDSPVLRHYRVDYPNVAREARSSVSASSSIGSGGGNSGGSGTGNSSSSSLANTSNNRFWETLTQNIRDLLRETDRFVPEGGNTGQQVSQASTVNSQVGQLAGNLQTSISQTPSGASGSASGQASGSATAASARGGTCRIHEPR